MAPRKTLSVLVVVPVIGDDEGKAEISLKGLATKANPALQL